MSLMIWITLYAVWWISGIVLTVRAITMTRDFELWEIFPTLFCSALIGPLMWFTFADIYRKPPTVLFRRRNNS